MQNSDGGWAAFDRDINREVLTQGARSPITTPCSTRVVPTSPPASWKRWAITAIALEHPQVDRALAFMRKTQDARGCWLGRWGVNYLYGTWQVLVGLQAHRLRHAAIRWCGGRSAWLKQVQQPGGGWGETCRSYDDPSLAGQGTPTASQTAWALLALLAAGEADSDDGPRAASTTC